MREAPGSIPGAAPLFDLMNFTVGCDLVKIVRIERLVEKYGTRFLRKVSPNLIQQPVTNVISRVSGMWAVREAAYKAWYQMSPEEAKWSKVYVEHNGIRPIVKLNSKKNVQVQASVSHDGGFTMAICVCYQ